MHDAIEIQLAHTVGNAVSQAYNHAQHLEYRTFFHLGKLSLKSKHVFFSELV